MHFLEKTSIFGYIVSSLRNYDWDGIKVIVEEEVFGETCDQHVTRSEFSGVRKKEMYSIVI